MSNILQNSFFKTVATICCILTGMSLSAQTSGVKTVPSGNDTLSLNQIMDTVIQNYPGIKEAEEAINKADAQIGLAKSGYYPNVDASLNVSNIGPVPEIPFNGQNFKLYPNDNFDAGLNVSENIYDFGKTSSNTAFAKANKDLMEKSLATAKQKLAIRVIQNYYMLVYLQDAIKIKDEQLKVLKEHLNYVKKMKATGSGTNYDILSTQVKMSNVENQKLDITASRDVQLSVLNSLLGLPTRTFHAVKDTISVVQPDIAQDSVISYALNHRDEMEMALKKTDMASIHLDVVKAQTRPSLNFIAKGGWKNGYPFDVNKIRPNYLVGIGLKVPIFDATRLKYNIMLAKSSIESSTLESEVTKRNISSEVIENETKLLTASKKLDQSKLQLSQAKEAFNLAKTNYSAGAITNLDLLDATTNVSESELMVLRSKIDYAISIYRYKASLGEQLY